MAHPDSVLPDRLQQDCALAVRADADGSSALLRFSWGNASSDPVWPLGLQWIGGDLLTETWHAEGERTQGREGAIDWVKVGGCLSLTLVLDDRPEQDPEPLVYGAYRDLIAFAEQQGHPHLLRAWNYFPAINEGSGNSERYRRFCQGRARALEDADLNAAALCAGTAIGGRENKLRIYLLCGSSPGLNIENPRQISAYRYPKQYGPRSPSFARATLLPAVDGDALLMISGTASVVGHASQHAGDVLAQTQEILTNIDSLLAESERRSGCRGLSEFNSNSLVRVYVRDPSDWPRIEPLLRNSWPSARMAAFCGDVCRADLLVEIEAVTQA